MSNAPTQANGLPEEALLQQAAAGELEALRQLDSMGFIMGPTETPEAFAARIRTLKANIAKMDKSLADTGKYEVEGVAVSTKDRISRKLFDSVVWKSLSSSPPSAATNAAHSSSVPMFAIMRLILYCELTGIPPPRRASARWAAGLRGRGI